MNSFWTVVKFTLLNRVKSKAFFITSIIFILLISLGVNLPAIIHQFTAGKVTKVGMVRDAGGIAESLQKSLQQKKLPDLSVVLYPPAGSAASNESALSRHLKNGDIKGYLLLQNSAAAGFPDAVYKADNMIGTDKKKELLQALQIVKITKISHSMGLSGKQLAQLEGPVHLNAIQLTASGAKGGKSESERNAAYALVYVLLFLIFMMVQLYGNMIATEITAEKSSRVMELLITSVSPLKQMFGKITGMFLLALMQLLLFVITGAANLLSDGNLDTLRGFGLNFHNLPPSLLLYFLLFFVLGFFLIATMLAGVGSLVSRTEDLGQAVLPVTLVSLASFYVSIYALNAPSSNFTVILSFIPVFTPMLMFLRIGMVGVPFWQIGLSLVELAGFNYLTTWFAAKIYRTGVLMYGKRPGLKEIRRAMKAFRVR